MKVEGGFILEFNEKLLCHIWDAQHLTKDLNTVSGKPLRIIYPGRWNTDRGPDFRDIVVEIDGTLFRGDAEVHLDTYGWKAHGHDDDFHYNNVILHIVYEHNGYTDYTFTEDGSHIEIIELKHSLDDDLSKLIKKYEGSPFIPQLCHFFAGIDANSLQAILSKLGNDRMKRKVNRFAAELYFSDFNQLIYQGILEAGGYSKNSHNMIQIANFYPYADLKRWKAEGMTLLEMQAILVCGSGLSEHLTSVMDDNFLLDLKNCYALQNFTSTKIDLEWQLFRIRPTNHPLIRLIQLSYMIYNSLETSLLAITLNVFSVPINERTVKTISVNLHKLFYEKTAVKPFRIGITRIDIINVNIIIPIIILYAEKMGYETLANTAWDIYREYRALPPNAIESMLKKKYMNESQQSTLGEKAIYQQGLLKLYKDFCQYHNCELCVERKRELISEM
ncbi:MAG: DUF2851 family protein [Candidatus Cloacimonas sp.]|nr:DUF2851 family protein [Candidatus Cloacimonadota bacterium]